MSFSIGRAGPSRGYFVPSYSLPGAPGPSSVSYEAHGHVDQGDICKFLNPTIAWFALLCTLSVNCHVIHCTCTFPSNIAHDRYALIIPAFIIIAQSDDQQLRSRFEMLTRPAKEALVVRFSIYNTPKATRSTLAQLMTQFQVLHVHV